MIQDIKSIEDIIVLAVEDAPSFKQLESMPQYFMSEAKIEAPK